MSLKNQQITLALLVDMQLPSYNARYTSLDEKITYNSNVYYPRKMEITNVDMSVVNSTSEFSFTLDNVDRKFDTLFFGTDVRGSKVDIYLIALDDTVKILDTYHLYSGYIEKFSVDKEKAEITLTDELIFWTKTTLRKHTYQIFPTIKDVEEKPLLWGTNKLTV